MSNYNDEISKKWRIIVILSVVFLIVLISQDILREIFVFKQETAMISDALNRDVRNDVYTSVNNVKEDFLYSINNIGDLLVEHSRENIEGLLFAADMVYDINSEAGTEDIEEDIIEITYAYDELDLKHNYHIFNVDGVLVYDGNSNIVVNLDQIDETDGLNREYVREFIETITLSELDEAIVPYYIYEGEELNHYIMYGKQISGTDLILTSIVDMSVFSEEVKMNLINGLENSHTAQIQNVYVISLNGDLLYHTNGTYVGMNYVDIDNDLWSTTIESIVGFASNNQEGHLEYDFASDYYDGEIESKIAYLYIIDEWDIIIGSSKDMDTYDEIIANYAADNYRLVMYVKTPAYLAIFSLAAAMYVYLRRNVKLSLEVLEEEELLYRKFADLTNEVILMTNSHGEIIFANKLGRKTVFGKREKIDGVFFDQILVEEEGYYILYGYTEDFYVKFVMEEVQYNNMKVDLYIITDVTEKIKTERKLEALSLNDELTALGNRRLMVEEYNEIILPAVKAGNESYLAMIDLDDFKVANDTYGHSYGDQVLRNVTGIFIENANENIHVYRIGGDEFTILFLNLSEKEVFDFLKMLQKEVSSYEYEKNINIGFSAGVSKISVSTEKRRFSDFYDVADKLLYKSKHEGKNTINF